MLNHYRQTLKTKIEKLNDAIVKEYNNSLIEELKNYKKEKGVNYLYQIESGMGSLSIKVYGKRRFFEVFAYDILRDNKKWVRGRLIFKDLQEIVRYYQELGSCYFNHTI